VSKGTKRVKVSGCNDNWTTFVVQVDGVPLEVEAVSLNVSTDTDVNTVTLVLSALDVELDIRTSSEVGGVRWPAESTP
jgi:hypothetical protein